MSEENESPKRKKINWTTDKIMSTSALFISVISLIALLYQSYLAREDNKLTQKQQSASVLPHLNQWYSNKKDSFKFIVGNKGVGPAFIESINIVLDSTHRFNNTDALFNHIFNKTSSLDTIPYTTSTLIKGFVLPANEQINVLEIYDYNNIEAFQKVMSAKKVLYEITYKDVYGAQWLLTNLNDNPNSANIPVLVTKD